MSPVASLDIGVLITIVTIVPKCFDSTLSNQSIDQVLVRILKRNSMYFEKK